MTSWNTNTNTSATGGPLFPSPPDANTPLLEGAKLNAAIQQWVVSLLGIQGQLVRPAFQPEPPDIPQEGQAWVALQIKTLPGDTFPYVNHDPDAAGGLGADRLTRNEKIEVLSSFYDLGTNGLADHYARWLKDGIAIPQNRESIFPILVGDVGDLVVAPTMLKERWLYRVDFPFELRRAYTRVYQVKSVASFVSQIVVQDPAGNNIYITVNATGP